jgi:tetrahydromethanopterin S-methyltransferase subunit H
LKGVIAIRRSRWRFKGAETQTYIGPTAQCYFKTIALGVGDKTISAMDSSGVALAVIEGLHKMLKDKDAKLDALESATSQGREKIAAIEKRLSQ